MFKLAYSDNFRKNYQRLTKEQQQATNAKLAALADDPWRKSLRVKRIKSTALFECSVNMDIRIAFKFNGDTLILLLDIDHHDKLFRRVKRTKG
jgi:mRNA-degrading endonuclease YafQ of YafQ-DinJ toxin-antitoxin module